MATCIFCSLRIGLIIYGSFLVLAYIVKLAVVTYLFFYTEYTDTWQQNIQQSAYLVQFSVTVASLLNSGLLLLGAASKNDNILRPWLCVSFVLLLTIFCNAIFQLYEADIATFSLTAIELLTNGIGYSCVFCHFEEFATVLSDLSSSASENDDEDTEDAGGGESLVEDDVEMEEVEEAEEED